MDRAVLRPSDRCCWLSSVQGAGEVRGELLEPPCQSCELPRAVLVRELPAGQPPRLDGDCGLRCCFYSQRLPEKAGPVGTCPTKPAVSAAVRTGRGKPPRTRASTRVLE